MSRAPSVPPITAPALRALEALHGEFTRTGAEHVASGAVANALGMPPDRVARLLASFGVRPKQIWVSGRKRRGYRLEECRDAFASNLDPTAQVLRQLAAQGVGVLLHAGYLHTAPPLGMLTPLQRAMVERHKAALIAFLSRR
jgi:NADH/NAD ratio-sensing transcriptional regulator Rex